MLTITPTQARRLAVTAQQLAGPRPETVADVLHTIRALQIDPIRAVEYTQLLVLWSRLGNYDPAELDHLLYEERAAFEYFAHAASIVLTKDYPIFHVQMRHRANGGWSESTRQWIEERAGLREQVLAALHERGPLPSQEIAEPDELDPISSRWYSGRNVPIMLDLLWTEGKVMVAGRRGRTRLWDLAERCLPSWTPQEKLEREEATTRAVQHALRALGVGTVKQIKNHFTRGKYPELSSAMKRLLKAKRIRPVEIVSSAGESWPGQWYVHEETLPLLEALQDGAWQPRTTLLSPFDNLICDRDRTEQLFDFYYRIEIYVPAKKREYGYYVLPILHGDRVIGRIDPKMDRKHGRLEVNGVFAEEGVDFAATGPAVAAAIGKLARFLGAKEIVYPQPERIAAGWQPFLG